MTDQGLKRSLPGRFAIAVTVGGVIGLGVLRGPGEIAEVVPEPVWYLALWLLGGLFVLLSTAVGSELLGMTPRSGGFYALIHRAYGPYPGFVIGWLDWLSFVVDIALKAVVIMEFVAILFPETAEWRTALGIIVTTVFAAVQLRGLTLGALIQESATALIGALAFIILAGGGFKHGEHKAYPTASRERVPLANLYLSMLHRFGVETDFFSQSTRTLSGLDLAGS